MLLSKESGVHAPDSHKLELWVNSQVSERRRKAARALADNLNYFSFDDVRNMCKKITKEIYKKNIPNDKELIWFGVDFGKSGMFIAALCYHYAAEMGLRLPFRMFDFVIPNGAVDFSKSVLMCFDDMSYSGSQMSTRLGIIREQIKKKGIPLESTDIRVGFISVSETANNILQRVHPSTLFVSGAVIPSLKKALGTQQWIDCIVYFSLYHPDNFTFFEHKLADDISTFLKVFKYGLVPPANITFSNEVIDKAAMKIGTDMWHFSIKYIDKELKKLNGDDSIYKYLTQSDDPIDDDKKGIEKIQFIPFITGCEIPAKVISDLENMNYIELLMVDPEEDDAIYGRCPPAFYKKLKGGRKLRKTKRKSRKHKNRTYRKH